MENSIEEDMKILEGIIKGDEDCINAIYSQMKVKNDDDEDIQYYKKEIQSIKNIVDNYLKEKARADKLEKEYSAMLTKSDEDECDYKRVLKENEELKNQEATARRINELLVQRYSNSIPVQIAKDKIEELKINLVNMQGEELLIYESKIDVLQELLESEEIEMEEKYINKILNFADENINTAKELVINKEQANGIIKELQEDYTPNAIIRLKIAEYKERKAKCNDIETEVRLDVKIRAYEELLEGRK